MSGQVGIVLEQNPEEKHLRILFAILSEMKLQSKLLRNEANPVDEYEYNQSGLTSPGTGSQSPVTIQAAFSGEVRIESITAILPVGITFAQLQLGKRYIPLYSGAATTLLTTVNLVDQGIILNGADDRFLTWTGAATSGYYIALSGFKAGREYGA